MTIADYAAIAPTAVNDPSIDELLKQAIAKPLHAMRWTMLARAVGEQTNLDDPTGHAPPTDGYRYVGAIVRVHAANDRIVTCTATALNNSVILTAAHCLFDHSRRIDMLEDAFYFVPEAIAYSAALKYRRHRDHPDRETASCKSWSPSVQQPNIDAPYESSSGVATAAPVHQSTQEACSPRFGLRRKKCGITQVTRDPAPSLAPSSLRVATPSSSLDQRISDSDESCRSSRCRATVCYAVLVPDLRDDLRLRSLVDCLHAQSLAQDGYIRAHFAEQGSRAWSARSELEEGRAFWRDMLVALDADKAQPCHALCRALGARRIVEAGTSFGDRRRPA